MSSTISVPNRLQRSNGNKAHPLRPIYLISKTPFPGVLHIPILKTRFFTPEIDFSVYDGLLITSKQVLKALKPYSQSWKNLPIIAVSETTAEAFRMVGCTVAAVAQGYGEGIAQIVSEQFPERRWLYLRPVIVAGGWVEEAVKSGVSIDQAVVYETDCDEEAAGSEIASDAVLIFTSPSGVECFCKKQKLLPTHTVIAIGKTTQKALPEGVDSSLADKTSVASAVEKARVLAKISSPF